MKESIKVTFRFRRSQVSLEVLVRQAIAERHRAMAGVLRHATLEAYFDDCLAQEKLETALEFITNPSFAGFSRVEFAQELLDTAFGGLVEMPWGGDPEDMPEEEFRELVQTWIASLTEDRGHHVLVVSAAEMALAPYGSAVADKVEPVARWLAERAMAAEEQEIATP